MLLLICVYIEVMPGTLTVENTVLGAECAVEVKYNRPKNSSPDCKGKPSFLTDCLWYYLDELIAQGRHA